MSFYTCELRGVYNGLKGGVGLIFFCSYVLRSEFCGGDDLRRGVLSVGFGMRLLHIALLSRASHKNNHNNNS